MKFTQTGTKKEDALDKLVAIKPTESVQNILLEFLDYFIGFIAKERPEVMAIYAANLKKKFQGLAGIEPFNDLPEEINRQFSGFNNIAQYLDLFKASLNYFLELLTVNSWESDETEVSMRALVQAWVFPPYYFLETLAETIDREDAVKLYKRYITNYYLDHPSPNREEDFNLEKLVEKRLSGDTTSSEWVIVHSMIADGKYAFKNENCPTCVDTMTELPDVEFKYLVCCYGDFQKFRAIYSDHLILTMEHTLMQGDPYCSRVLHDTRIDYDLRHPPTEFWDNFYPGNEKEAIKHSKI